jgi:tetratricopeptide (TPR) repeat protein
MFNFLIYIILFFVFVMSANAQSQHEWLRKGDIFFKKNDFEKAANCYQKAKISDGDKKGVAAYNLAVCLQKQSNYTAAISEISIAVSNMADKKKLAMSHYNLGNNYFLEKKYVESIENYKKSLRFDPNDFATKQNLFLAQQKLAEQQTPPQDKSSSNNPKNKEETTDNNTPKDKKGKEQLLKMVNEKENQVQQKKKVEQRKIPVNGKDW